MSMNKVTVILREILDKNFGDRQYLICDNRKIPSIFFVEYPLLLSARVDRLDKFRTKAKGFRFTGSLNLNM